MKKMIIIMMMMVSGVLTACMGVNKIEKKTELDDKTIGRKQISEIFFEKKEISEIRANAEKSMGLLGSEDSDFPNLGQTKVAPIITTKDSISALQLKKLEGNELTGGGGFSETLASKKIIDTYEVYRNDQEKVKKKIHIVNGTNIEDMIQYVENYLDTIYSKSEFKWIVEYVTVHTSDDQKEYADVSVRPSYDGVVFTGRLVLNNGIPDNIAKDFRGGHLCISRMNEIDEYHDISPYYEIEKQGEPIGKILSIESVLSIVSNKVDHDTISNIKIFELAYRLKKDLSAVPIWNVVVNENGNDRNFQIDAVTGDVYFE